MRIGLISYEYPPQRGLGGVGTYTFRLAGALGRVGHEVVVLAGPSTGPEQQQANVTVHRLPARYDPPLAMRGARWLYWRVVARAMEGANPLVWHWLRWDLASGAAMADLHSQDPFDVIEAPEHAANGLMVARDGRWPLVVRVHGPWDLFYPINRTRGFALNRLLAGLERQSAMAADVLTTPSATMAQFIQGHWGLEHPPLPIPNFMDVPDRPPPLPDPHGEQRIVCAGRLERFKGQDVLVRAFEQVAHVHPRARLILLGPDQWSASQPFSALVQRLVPDPAIRARIELTGPQKLPRIQRELANAAVAVVPSSGFESFSFSTLEAMAAGRPTIVSRAGAMPELLDHGRCGVVVEPGDAAGFAGALDMLLSDHALAGELAARAHQRALEMYDTAAVLPAYEAAYESAMERRARPAVRCASRPASERWQAISA